MSNNVYNTTDLERLLRLKKLEAEALRDVIRAFKTFHNRPSAIFKIAQNTLMAQLGVNKMLFLYKTAEGMQTGISRGIGPLESDAISELPQTTGVIQVNPTQFPGLSKAGIENIVTLSFQDKPGAWFCISDFADNEVERENDLIFIETLGQALTAVLDNHYLVTELIREEGVRSQLEVAEKIQRQLLPTRFDDIVGAEIATFNEPHHKVGGDYFDAIPRGNKGFFVCIADVAGKGIGAALLMANLQAQLRALILSENSLKDIITKLNRGLISITGGDQFVTFFLAHVRLHEREMDYINAGHHFPLLKSENKVKELKDGTIPLGLMELPFLNEGTISWKPGDRLFFFTDGLSDQVNEKDEKIGDNCVYDWMHSWENQSPAEWIAWVIKAWKTFAKGAPASDDVSMLALAFKETE